MEITKEVEVEAYISVDDVYENATDEEKNELRRLLEDWSTDVPEVML